MKNKAVFLDRDGVINEDKGYLYRIEDFEFIPEVFDSLLKLQKLNYKLIIITNQSGIGRGYYTLEDFNKLNDYMLRVLGDRGIKIDKVYFCPHSPNENCECRKPKTKFIYSAVKEFDLDLSKCWIIGDKPSDIEMGKNCGCKALLIDSKYVKESYDLKFMDLESAVSHIIESSNF